MSIETQGPLSDGGSAAFIQVQGVGDDDACGPNAGSIFGCQEVGGNNVYKSFNGQGNWVMYNQGTGPEAVIGGYAPSDFEIRVRRPVGTAMLIVEPHLRGVSGMNALGGPKWVRFL